MTPKEMEKHLRALAQEHSISLELTDDPKRYRGYGSVNILEDSYGESFVQLREVRATPIKTDRNYGTALHEMGHIMTTPTSFTEHYRKLMHDLAADQYSDVRDLNVELEAWQWAKDNAKVWTPDMACQASRALNSYLMGTKWTIKHFQAHPLLPMLMPAPKPVPPDHPVWSWIIPGCTELPKFERSR